MDPSNNNSFGSPQVPGSSGGAGLSGADFGAQNVGNVAQSTGSTAQNVGAIVSGAGTTVDNTGTGGAGGFKSSNFPSGGITIGGEKRSRKGLIIAGFVFFALAIGGGIAALVLMNNGGSSSGESSNGGSNSTIVVDENVSMEVAFNRYANYLVSGEVKDEAVDAEVFDEQIVFDENYDDKQYVENANSLYNVFYKKTTELSADDDYPFFQIEQIKEELSFLNDERSFITVNEKEIVENYLESGKKAAENYVSEEIVVSSDSVPTILARYQKAQKAFADTIIEYMDSLTSLSCVVNKGIAEECVSNNAELTDLNNKIGVARRNANSFKGDIAVSISRHSKTISEVINSEDKNE